MPKKNRRAVPWQGIRHSTQTKRVRLLGLRVSYSLALQAAWHLLWPMWRKISSALQNKPISWGRSVAALIYASAVPPPDNHYKNCIDRGCLMLFFQTGNFAKWFVNDSWIPASIKIWCNSFTCKLKMRTSRGRCCTSCEQLQGWTHVSMFWGGGQTVCRLHCSPTHTTTCGAFHSGIFVCDGHIINPDVELIATAEPVSNIHVCSSCKTSQRAEIKRHNDP